MASSIFFAVAGATFGSWRKRLETVIIETPATLATSSIAGSGVIEFGFAALSRTTATEYPLDLKVTATFSDTSSSSLVSTLGNTKGLSDTFYYFAASEGNFITGITMETFLPGTDTLVNSRIAFDNVGFVTSIIPEPHTYALFAGVIGLGLAVMRRRRS